jgi:hypothetical protein
MKNIRVPPKPSYFISVEGLICMQVIWINLIKCFIDDINLTLPPNHATISLNFCEFHPVLPEWGRQPKGD